MEQKSEERFDLSLYKKFYDAWVRSASEMLNEVMRSPQFADGMGKWLQGSLDFKKRLDEVIESSLKEFRLPTSSGVGEVSSRVRALEQQIQGLSKKLEELQAHFPSSPKGPVSRKQSVQQAKK